jgi:hypothetical protein
MKKIIAALTFVAPSIAFAQTAPITDVNGLSSKLLGIGNTVTYILVALGVLFIVWNVVIYLIKGSAEDEKRTKAGMNILWGIVGLFVIVSIWGLVNILTNTFKTTPTNQPIPNFSNNTGTGGIPGNQVPIVQ